MSARSEESAAELRLAPESIEALASRLAELLAGEPGPREPQRRLSAAQVARLWGVGRRWVYEHADELGASRLGSGPRPRLRFDPDEVAERLGEPPADRPRRRDVRGSRRSGGDCGIDSLSPRSRATVAERHRNGRGGAVTPPDPAPG